MQENILSRLTIDKAAVLYEKFGNRFLTEMRKNKLSSTEFSIISNNCWGGHVYRHFGIPYSSPTVGTYFFSEDYIRLVSDVERNIYLPLTFISSEESKYREQLHRKRQTNVPIGMLGDSIEIIFLHYASCEEAYEKWNRRLERLYIDNLIVKFSEMNLCEKRHLEAFEKLKYNKKLLLLSEPCNEAPSGIVVTKYAKNHQVTNDTTYYWLFTNLVDLING